MEILKGLFFNFDAEPFRILTQWILISYTAVLLAMAVDLIAGVWKARVAGIARTSTGYRKTVNKAGKYFLPMFVISCIDVLTASLWAFPYLTLAVAVFCCYCEFKSVWENTHTKAEIRRAEKTMNIIVENKEEIAEAVIAILMRSEKAPEAIVEAIKKFNLPQDNGKVRENDTPYPALGNRVE